MSRKTEFSLTALIPRPLPSFSPRTYLLGSIVTILFATVAYSAETDPEPAYAAPNGQGLWPCPLSAPCDLAYLLALANGTANYILLGGTYDLSSQAPPGAPVGRLALAALPGASPVLRFTNLSLPWIKYRSLQSLNITGLAFQGLQGPLATLPPVASVALQRCSFADSNIPGLLLYQTLTAQITDCEIRRSSVTLVAQPTPALGSSLEVSRLRILDSSFILTTSGSLNYILNDVYIALSRLDASLVAYNQSIAVAVHNLTILDSTSLYPLITATTPIFGRDTTISDVQIRNYASFGPIIHLKSAGTFSFANFIISQSVATSFLRLDGPSNVSVIGAGWRDNSVSEGLLYASQGYISVYTSIFGRNKLTDATGCGTVVRSTGRARFLLDRVEAWINQGGISMFCLDGEPCCSVEDSPLVTRNCTFTSNDHSGAGSTNVGLCFTSCSANTTNCTRALCEMTQERTPIPLNSCDLDDNPCDADKSTCAFLGFGRYDCICKNGYKPLGLKRCVGVLPFTAAPDGIIPRQVTDCQNVTCNLGFLFSLAGAGNTISLAPGTYGNETWTNAPVLLWNYAITIQAMIPGTVTIDFTTLAQAFDLHGAYYGVTTTFAGIRFRGAHALTFASNYFKLVFQNCEFVDMAMVGSASFITASSSELRFDNCTFHGFSGQGRILEAQQNTSSVFINTQFFDIHISAIMAQRVTFESSIFRDSQMQAPFIQITKTLVIRNSLFTRNTGTTLITLENGANFTTNGWTVEACTFKTTLVSSSPALLGPNYLDIQNSTLLNSKAPDLISATGAIFKAFKFTCMGNVGRCLTLVESAVDIQSSSFQANTPADDPTLGCAALSLVNTNQPAAVLTNVAFGNNLGEGNICLRTSTCKPMLRLLSPEFSNVRWVYLEWDSPLKCTTLWSTDVSVTDGREATYPARLVSKQGQSVSYSYYDGQTANVTLFIQSVDQFGQAVTGARCSQFGVCWNTRLVMADSSTPLPCNDQGYFVFRLEIRQPRPGQYPITFSADTCNPAPEFHLGESLTVQVEFTLAPLPQLPFTWTVLIVLGASIIAVAGLSALFVFIRRKMAQREAEEDEPLLSQHRELGTFVGDDGRAALQPIYNLLEETKVPVIPPDEIEYTEVVGAGATGMVVVGRWVKKNLNVAVKQISTSTITAEGWSDTQQEQVKELIREMAIMVQARRFSDTSPSGSDTGLLQLSHPHLLPLLGCSVLGETDIRLVTPFMSNKSLESHITTLPNDLVLPIVKQIAWACEYLHSKDWTHRDLKPENVLTNIEPNGSWKVFVCDFALTKASSADTTGSRVGTPAYMAPEVIKDANNSPAIDVYAFGVIVLELMTHTRVYQGMQPMSILNRVGNQGITPTVPPELDSDDTRPNWLPRELVELVKRCLLANPDLRPTMKEICVVLRPF